MTKKTILAAIDLLHKEADAHIAAEALALAKSHDANLHLVFVIPDQQNSYVQNYVSSEMREQVNKDAVADLEAYVSKLDAGGVSVSGDVRRGIVYDQIVKLADQTKASFVVIGAHKPGFKDFFMGPNAARVARHARCSVLVVRPEPTE